MVLNAGADVMRFAPSLVVEEAISRRNAGAMQAVGEGGGLMADCRISVAHPAVLTLYPVAAYPARYR